MDSVNGVLNDLFPYEHLIAAPTHQVLSRQALKRLGKHQSCFIGGSNLLTAHRRVRRSKNSWRAGMLDAFYFENKGIVLGAGCEKKDNVPNYMAKTFYSKMLSDKYIHSVRDQAGVDLLERSGVKNVLNTACPTMWNLTPEHCGSILNIKSTSVVFTLTDYHQSKVEDSSFIKLLLSNYQNVYFWPQGSRDLEYIKSIGLSSGEINAIQFLKTNLSSYDQLLKEVTSLDYVGTRLHAGIRALQFKKRSLIITIDNRAQSLSSECGLPTAMRGDNNALTRFIDSNWMCNIVLPTENIQKWKRQFK